MIRSLLAVAVIGVVVWGCAAGRPAPDKTDYTQGGTIAVWDLEDASVQPRVDADLNEFFSAKMIETVMNTGKYTAVERKQLLLVLEELNLGSSAVVDQGTRLRIGEMLCAQLMIFGIYQTIGDQTRIDMRLVAVETGSVVNVAEKTIQSVGGSQMIDAVGEAAEELLTF